jgi:hypothetical protein
LKALKPLLGQLYGSHSLSSKDPMQRTIDGAEKVLSFDRETEAMIERLPESVKISQAPLRILSIDTFPGD